MKVQFFVQAPKDATPDQVARILQTMLDIGKADAETTLRNPESADNADALLASRLRWGNVNVQHKT
jgi:hypothetical protein